MAKLKNIELVNEMVEQGYIDVVKHPIFDLWIYNYSRFASFECVWNEATEQCRGVIVDKNMNIVARPFNKFYNYEELLEMGVEIPNLPFTVSEKLDGSLGILYWYNDVPYIATRGSFDSDQAKHATNILHTKYSNIFDKLDKTKTYLFEIIYPENQMVVSYHGMDDIVLLAIFDNETGSETDRYEYKDIFKVAERYDGFTDYTKIRDAFSGENREGFVVRFENGFRMKLKFEEYWKIHFIISGFTEKRIFEYLSTENYDAINEAMKYFDEEHTIFYNNIIKKYWDAYDKIVNQCTEDYRAFDTDKEAAEYFKTCTYPAVLFLMRKGKSIEQTVWKIIKKQFKKNNLNMIKENVNTLIMAAMKSGDKIRTEAIRSIKTAIMQWETAKENVGKKYDESVEVSILKKLVAQYKDTAESCNDGKHDELVKNSLEYANIISEFLPAPVTEKEIINILEVLSIPHTKPFMGQLIKEIKRILPAADGKLISQIVMKNIN